jgi:hypothetical protein
MKKITFILSVLFLSATLVHLDSSAQQRRNLQGRGIGQRQNLSRMYNPQTVVTIKGVVNEVERVQSGPGGYLSIHIKMGSEEGIQTVHLGPAWFIEKEMKIAPSDILEITGSKIIYNDTPAIIAAQIKMGDQTLQIRNEIGVPVWSRSGMGRRRQ